MDPTLTKLQNLNLQDIWKGKKSGVEENVKIIIVLPILESLGFNRQTDMDFEHYIENKKADIALLVDGLPKVVVECKSLEKNLDDYISQALNYAINKSIPYVLLTNGKEFRLYRPFIENIVNPKDRLLVSVHLKTLERDMKELRDWISKESLINRRIDKKADRVAEKLTAEITPLTLIENLKNAKEILTDDASSRILPTFGSDIEFRKLVDEWVNDSELDITKTQEWVEILANEISYSFINRLYFVRIAQDRGIVKQKLTKQAISQITQYLDYKDLMKTVFEEILRIDYQAIFKHDIFDKVNFSEGVLKRIVDELANYNFAKINSDIIGRIYEYHVSREERKKLGQFYTPDYIIDFILDNIPLKTTDRLLDPACGSGGFLIRAYDKFVDLHKGRKLSELHREILENNIFGYDINPFAVHLTGMNLALKNIESKTDALNVLENDSLTSNLNDFSLIRIKTLQSQIREVKKDNHVDFDVVVGNPPYFNLNSKQIEEKYGSQGFEEVSTGVTNIAALFLSKYIRLLKPGGYLGFVVPKSLTYLDSWEGTRRLILRETQILKIFDVHEAFKGVLLEQVGIVLQKRPCANRDYVEVKYVDLPYTKNETKGHSVKNELFTEQIFPIYQSKENEGIYKSINENSVKLSDISEPIFRGPTVQKYGYLFTDEPKTDMDLPILRGKNIEQFRLKGKMQYVSRDRPEFGPVNNQIERLLRPKIMGQRLIAQTGNHMKLIAALDERGKFVEVDTINNIVLRKTDLDLKYILGIINSKIASYYVYSFIFNRAVRTMDFKYVSQLPIKIVPQSIMSRVIKLVGKLLNTPSNSSDTVIFKSELDQLIYEVYGLTKKQIKIIEDNW